MTSHQSAAALSLVILTALLPARSEGQTQTTAFVNVSVIPMDRERVLPDQTVLVQGGHIIALGTTGAVPLPAGTTVVDGKGKFLIPGLADMHVHLDGHDESGALDEATLTEAALMLYVANGVTTIRNMRGKPEHVALRDRAAKGELLSPRIYTAGPTVYSAEDINTPDAARQLIADHKAERYDFIKVHDISITPEAFDTFAAIAHSAGIPFAGHTPANVGVERMVRARPASIEHLGRFYLYAVGQDIVSQNQNAGVSPVDLTPDESKIAKLAQLIKEAGVWICPTELITQTGGPDRASGKEGKVFVTRRKIIKALHDAGAGLLLGSDGGPGGVFVTVSPRDDIPPASEAPFELALLKEAGLTSYQALETATRNPATFLGALDSTGTIAVGKRADLVLLNGNPLEDLNYTKRPVGTMLGGQWLPRTKIIALVAAKNAPEYWYRD